MKVKIYVNTDDYCVGEQFPRVLTEKQYQEKTQELIKDRMENGKPVVYHFFDGKVFAGNEVFKIIVDDKGQRSFLVGDHRGEGERKGFAVYFGVGDDLISTCRARTKSAIDLFGCRYLKGKAGRFGEGKSIFLVAKDVYVFLTDGRPCPGIKGIDGANAPFF